MENILYQMGKFMVKVFVMKIYGGEYMDRTLVCCGYISVNVQNAY